MEQQKKKRGNYALNQSPLYKLRNQQRLAALIRIDLKKLYLLLDAPCNYRVFPQGKRTCHDPKPILKAIHKRLQILLNRIAPPDYLHSATKGRSYVTNAAAHLGNKRYINWILDIFTMLPPSSIYMISLKTRCFVLWMLQHYWQEYQRITTIYQPEVLSALYLLISRIKHYSTKCMMRL